MAPNANPNTNTNTKLELTCSAVYSRGAVWCGVLLSLASTVTVYYIGPSVPLTTVESILGLVSVSLFALIRGFEFERPVNIDG